MATLTERAEGFAREVERAYGEELVSIVLYGSGARGDYQEGVSDLNMLVLLRNTEPRTLRRGTGLARTWVEKEGNPPPLIFGEDEWERSADAFPIEFADIRDAHRVLRGTDPFTAVEIDPEHLRLQCEHELKGKYLQLRERYLLTADRPDELGQLLVRAFPTFLVLFRTVLRLSGVVAPRDPEAVVRDVAARIGWDPEPFRTVLRARAGSLALLPMPDDPVVTGYLQAVARTVEWVDRLPDPLD